MTVNVDAELLQVMRMLFSSIFD